MCEDYLCDSMVQDQILNFFQFVSVQLVLVRSAESIQRIRLQEGRSHIVKVDRVVFEYLSLWNILNTSVEAANEDSPFNMHIFAMFEELTDAYSAKCPTAKHALVGLVGNVRTVVAVSHKGM